MGALQSQFAPPQPFQYIDQSDLGEVLVLKLSNTSVKWQHIELGEPFEVELGHSVCSMGFSLDIEFLLRSGVVNSKSGSRGWWLSTIPFDKGEDGAPVFDAQNGRLLGTLRNPDPKGVQGVSFLVPINMANAMLNGYAGMEVRRATALSLAAAFPSNNARTPKMNATLPTEAKLQLEVKGQSILNDAWPSSQIYVCWENPSPGFEHGMSLVREEVQETWEHESQLRLVGWQKCAPENRGIRIKMDDSESSPPSTKGSGRQLDGVNDGMILDFTFEKWGSSCSSTRDYCIKGTAGHVFGHAIGLGHEQNRPDTPASCLASAQGQNGPTLLTPYDPDSIMNYCNPKWNNDGKLSPLDIVKVRLLYGPPVSAGAQN
jgi:hypothetical protein